MTPIARPTNNTPDAVLRVMDRGVMGVQVPHVNTAGDARRAVKAVKFHPLGNRGLGGGTRSNDYGFMPSMAQYVEDVNRETLVCVQLEEAEASPEEVAATLEALQQVLPLHRGRPRKRFATATAEALETVSMMYAQANNQGMVTWLDQCSSAVTHQTAFIKGRGPGDDP